MWPKIGAITIAGALAAMSMSSSLSHADAKAKTPARAQQRAVCQQLLDRVNATDGLAIEVVGDPGAACVQLGFNVRGTWPRLYLEDCGAYENIMWLGDGRGGICRVATLARTGGY